MKTPIAIPVTPLGAVAVVFLVYLLGCGDKGPTANECLPELQEQLSEDLPEGVSWQDQLRQYAETHPPDEDAPVVVRPYTSQIRQELEALGARAFHVFGSFNGLFFIIEVEKLPEVADIEGIAQASLGAEGQFPVETCSWNES